MSFNRFEKSSRFCSDPAFDTGISKPSEIIWEIPLESRYAAEPAFHKTKQLQKTERPASRDNITLHTVHVETKA